MANRNAEDSICPAGWNLPVRGDIVNNNTDGSYTGLLRGTYGLQGVEGDGSANQIRAIPFSFIISGEYNHIYTITTIYNGMYATSTGNAAGTDVRLILNATNFGPYNSNNSLKDQGKSVRCVKE